ncbi:hypothetical protein HY450_02650, partial [Candidatus Pacearchaeota archaeon]|nr:hypothetical protein [Candidatus Pacearchaeota archaeon]
KMEKKFRVLFTFLFIVILITSLYIFTDWFSKITGYFGGQDEKESIVRCFNEKDAEIFLSDYCADCERQKEILGRAFSSVRSFDCGREKELCPNVKEVPALYIDKKVYYGVKNLTELDRIGNCGVF